MAFKSMLAEGGDVFKVQAVRQEAAKIAVETCQALEPFFDDNDIDIECDLQPRDQRCERMKICARLLIQLKFELMLAPKQYDLEWTSAGDVFDDGTMECKQGDENEGMKVKFCVCPGLVEYDLTPVAQLAQEDFASVLQCNKTFFLGKNATRKNRAVVAKSLVLVG